MDSLLFENKTTETFDMTLEVDNIVRTVEVKTSDLKTIVEMLSNDNSKMPRLIMPKAPGNPHHLAYLAVF